MSPMPRMRPASRSGWKRSNSASFSPVDANAMARRAEHGHVHLSAQRAQLLDGGGALEVGADEQRIAALLLEPTGELARVRRLAGALEARHQHDCRRTRGVGDADRLATERLD